MSWSPYRRPKTHSLRKLYDEVRERDGHRCQIRGTGCLVHGHEVDHIVPLFEGGTDDPTNLRVACSVCHGEKSTAERIRAKKRSQSWTFRAPVQHPGLR